MRVIQWRLVVRRAYQALRLYARVGFVLFPAKFSQYNRKEKMKEKESERVNKGGNGKG